MIWMISFFIALPIGVNVSEHHEEGLANSAPDKTNLKTKVIISFFKDSWAPFTKILVIESSVSPLYIAELSSLKNLISAFKSMSL